MASLTKEAERDMSHGAPAGSENFEQEASADSNGRHSEPIDDDVLHTVGRLFHTQPQQNNMIKGRKESMQEIVCRAFQAERNHWKERLQLSLHEIDRLHRVILTTHTGLQDIVKSLRFTMRRQTIQEDKEEEEKEEDQEEAMARMVAQIKFQVRQLKVKAGISDVSKAQYDDSQSKQRQNLKQLRDSMAQLQLEKEQALSECALKNEKILWLQKENVALHRQLQKLQGIVSRYNETSSGTNFHLNMVETPAVQTGIQYSTTVTGTLNKRGSMETLELSENGLSAGVARERTYTEGDQMSQYPIPVVENALVKDRLKKNIYSARKGDSRSSNVAKCFRCQALFKPSENTHRSCRFHHKGREITEQFSCSGKIEKVSYKWACCKKSLETPGCCFGYHV